MDNRPKNQTIVSLLTGSCDKAFKNCIAGFDHLVYQLLDDYAGLFSVEKMFCPEFWNQFQTRPCDMVLIPLNGVDLLKLEHLSSQYQQTGTTTPHLWSTAAPTVIVVLTGNNSQDAVLAAQMDFAGILTSPLSPREVHNTLVNACKRHQVRSRVMKRYQKIVGLLKRVNAEHKLLQRKVDLVCKDLVQSNIDLTRSINSLRDAYEFQMVLAGEFDLKMMLHRALAAVKNKLANTNMSIFLCQSRQFEAHIVADWFEQAQDLGVVEQAFFETLLPLSIKKALLLTDAGELPNLTQQQKSILHDLSILTIPVKYDETVQGILFLYRQAENPITNSERIAISALMPPLARTIESLQRLNRHLAACKA